MAADKISPNNGVRGHVTLWRVDDTTGLKTPVASQPNQIQYSWGYVAAKQLGYKRQADRLDYSISALYIEFENQATPELAISVAPFSRDIDIGYYNSLVDSSSRDFLRIR